MGKPFDHQYFFSGSGCSTGEMICATCHQPIFNHSQDWMSYKRSKSGDWAYICFHRKCCVDQTGWEKIETRHKKAMVARVSDLNKIRALASEIGVTDPDEFSDLAAEALSHD